MDDALSVGGVEAVGDLNSQVEQFTRFQSLATHVVAKCSPFEELHGEEVLAVDLANFVDRANVWMIQRGRGASFSAKALSGLRVAGKLFGKKFQRDESPKFEILGFVNHAHTAGAEFLQDSIMGNSSANHAGTPSEQGC